MPDTRAQRIRITSKDCGEGTYAVMRGSVMVATIHKCQPTRSNERRALWNICRMTGRVDWFDSFADVRDDALKG